MSKPYPNMFLQRELSKIADKPQDFYEILIDEFIFTLTTYNKYRSSNYSRNEINDFTVFVKNKNNINLHWEGVPCYWFNHDLGIFTNYYLRNDRNGWGVKHDNYGSLLGEDKKEWKYFKKFQNKYLNIINKKLILKEQLNQELNIKEEEPKKKVNKI